MKEGKHEVLINNELDALRYAYSEDQQKLHILKIIAVQLAKITDRLEQK